jgi:hypothetical protein
VQGITNNERNVERHEKAALVGRQKGLGRRSSTRAGLIPIRKTAAEPGSIAATVSTREGAAA